MCGKSLCDFFPYFNVYSFTDIGILNTFFNQTYRGHFKSTKTPACDLCVYIDGEEFCQTYTTHMAMRNYFHCRYFMQGCKAKALFSMVKTDDGKYEWKYHVIPHNKDRIHSHSKIAAVPFGEPYIHGLKPKPPDHDEDGQFKLATDKISKKN